MRVTSAIRRLLSRGPQALSREDAYARWAPSYPPSAHNPVMAVEASIMRPWLHAVNQGPALDVGTGSGRNVKTLLENGLIEVVGIDLSAAMLSMRHDCAPRVRGSATQLPFKPGSFNVVCSSLMCGDLDDLTDWLREAARVLRPGGTLMYSDFHESWKTFGWRRTFTDTRGNCCEVPIAAHETTEHVDALKSSGLRVDAVREAASAAGTPPVVVAFLAVKLAHGDR